MIIMFIRRQATGLNHHSSSFIINVESIGPQAAGLDDHNVALELTVLNDHTFDELDPRPA